ncbi:MAG: NADP-dependent malic enzyme [Halobacteriovoraceae bacterium]|nr:NADP-dependent malic enzyme [Halobacteriovoraceae bacterium]MCB9094052.1 NADP-dependent malic enzyme [Halobacteriovoraceae bacterium]
MSQIRFDSRLERKKEALDYHSEGRPGKTEVIPTKPCHTARDLSNAYSPGVAWPCLEIAENPEQVYKYTNKGNLIAVISNGSAVLGLGKIGALAGKPVMEGKGVLFKKFADIDVFDIEINETTIEGMVNTIAALEPTFGGINLEDIKAPECFEVETQLRERLKIPVFHDDQHGTAIITSAAFINAVEVIKKKINKLKIVFSGAGAASIACAKLLIAMGVDKKNIIMCDSKGVIYQGRTDGMNRYKEEFAIETKLRTLEEAMDGADAFVGLSQKGVLNAKMVKTMAKNPIIFAMANPDPEILPEEVAEVRDDAIMATGRSDYPNQVNNVLGFPFIFRGALDVRATTINEEMKIAAVNALARLAREQVPHDVRLAYGNRDFKFGREYLIPKPFDKRVLSHVAPAVAKAAMDSGVATKKIEDLSTYALSLEERLGNASSFMRDIRSKLPKDKRPRLVYTDGSHFKVLKALSTLRDEGVIEPIVLGDSDEIQAAIKKFEIDNLDDLTIVCPTEHPRFEEYCETYYNERQRKGLSKEYAIDTMSRATYFGPMMVKMGDADGMITGLGKTYSKAFKPVVRVLGNRNKKKASGVVILTFKNKVVFLADCTLQSNPPAADLVETAVNTVELYRQLMDKEPRVSFLSYSSFGSNRTVSAQKMSEAVRILQANHPDIIADGEMQADVAVNNELLSSLFPFSQLDKSADILIFPCLSSANIAYKLLVQLGGATPIGPILTPMDYPINILQRTANEEEIISMSHLTAIISQRAKEAKNEKRH